MTESHYSRTLKTHGLAVETRQSKWYRTRVLGVRAVGAVALLVAICNAQAVAVRV